MIPKNQGPQRSTGRAGVRRSLTGLVLALAGCAAPPIVTYDAARVPKERTATIHGASEDATFWRAMADGGRRGVTEIAFDAVNGMELEGPNSVSVEAGEVTLVCRVTGYVDGDLDPSVSVGRATFIAEPGADYRVAAVASEHQWPWSFRISRIGSKDAVGSSEPTLDDLRAPARPTFAQDWEPTRWRAYADGQWAEYAPSADARESWSFTHNPVGGSVADARALAEQAARGIAESFDLLASDERSFSADVTVGEGTNRQRLLVQWRTDGDTMESTIYRAPAESAKAERFRLD